MDVNLLTIGMHQPPQSLTPNQSVSPQQQKFECDKCNLIFPRFELFKEHQLIHLMNPNLFLNNELNQSYAENTPFGILQNIQQQQQQQICDDGETIDLSQKNNQSKRKYNELIVDEFPNEFEQNLNKKLKNEQFDFLYNYFIQNETNDELKKQNVDYEYLYQYYQTKELKQKGNFDFLYQYYIKNEKLQELNEKPNFEFLFQYYQMNESKKLFELDQQQQQQQLKPNDFLLMNQQPIKIKNLTPIPQQIPIQTQQQPIQPLITTTTTVATTTTTSSAASSDIEQQHLTDKQNNKRLRTTILPEQLNFLYECYQSESNPSRKMLEEISKKVNLKKRVVQVNTSRIQF